MFLICKGNNFLHNQYKFEIRCICFLDFTFVTSVFILVNCTVFYLTTLQERLVASMNDVTNLLFKLQQTFAILPFTENRSTNMQNFITIAFQILVCTAIHRYTAMLTMNMYRYFQ